MLFLLKAKMTWTIHKSGHLLHSFSDTGETNLLNKKLKRHFLFKAFFDKSFSQISCECLLSPKNFSQERLLPRQVIEGFTTSIHIYSSKIFREKEDMCTTVHFTHIIWVELFGSAKKICFVVFRWTGCRLRSRVCVGRVESVIGHSTGSQITFAQEHVRCLLRGKRYDYNLYISITTRNESQRCPKL